MVARWHLAPGGVLPYLSYTGTCRWTGYVFFRLAIASVQNSFKTCPEQGMILWYGLKARLRAVSFFSSPATWALREVERACD